jgi:hypothetical protein
MEYCVCIIGQIKDTMDEHVKATSRYTFQQSSEYVTTRNNINYTFGYQNSTLNSQSRDNFSGNGVYEFSLFNVAYLSVGLIGIFGNLFACIVIGCHRPLRKRIANYFLINQSVLDLSIGVMMILTSQVSVSDLRGTSLYVSCYLINSRVLYTSLLLASTWNLAAMATERYFEIVHPVRHKMKLSKDTVMAALVGCWIVGIAFKFSSVLPIVLVKEDNTCLVGWFPTRLAKLSFGLETAFGEFLLPLGIIAFCYIEMARAIRKRFSTAPTAAVDTASGAAKAPNGGATSTAAVASVGHAHMSRARRNVLRIMTIVIICFVLSIGPKQICLLLISVGLVQVDLNDLLYNMFLFLNYSNCCMNPFIYLFKYEEFQKYMSRNSHFSPVFSIRVRNWFQSILLIEEKKYNILVPAGFEPGFFGVAGGGLYRLRHHVAWLIRHQRRMGLINIVLYKV